MGLPPAILMLACAATIATGTTTATPDPTVGWQPPSALRRTALHEGGPRPKPAPGPLFRHHSGGG